MQNFEVTPACVNCLFGVEVVLNWASKPLEYSTPKDPLTSLELPLLEHLRCGTGATPFILSLITPVAA